MVFVFPVKLVAFTYRTMEVYPSRPPPPDPMIDIGDGTRIPEFMDVPLFIGVGRSFGPDRIMGPLSTTMAHRDEMRDKLAHINVVVTWNCLVEIPPF